MKDDRGFTLIELMITLAIFAIICAIAIPNMISWRSGARHRGAVNTLTGDLAVAKQAAIRNNNDVFVDLKADGYQLFLDTNSNNTLDTGADRVIRDRDLPAGVTLTPGEIRFNSRGICPAIGAGGTNLVVNSTALQNTVNVNRLGRISKI